MRNSAARSLFLILAGLVMLVPQVAAAQGFWVLERIKPWEFAVQPGPNAGKSIRYSQDVKPQGIGFAVEVTDQQNRVHPHLASMSWTFVNVGNGAVLPAGQQVQVNISGRHSGDLYNNAIFAVRVGEAPRQNPIGWRSNDQQHPAWSFRADPLLALNATNAVVWGTAIVRFPPTGTKDGDPFVILFHTTLNGTAGVEYIYRWSATAPSSASVALPSQVVVGKKK